MRKYKHLTDFCIWNEDFSGLTYLIYNEFFDVYHNHLKFINYRKTK